MKVSKHIDIFLTKKRNVTEINVSQLDTGVQLVFNVRDFNIPSGSSATLYAEKPSGKFVYQTKGITIVNNTITVDLENQAIAEHGKTPYQVSIANGSDVITSFIGVMNVQRSLKDSGASESKTVMRAFDELTDEKLAEFQTRAETVANSVIATIPEDYTKMTAKVNESANAIKGHLSGAVVRADDVSPVEHSPKVKVICPENVDPSTVTVTRCGKNLCAFLGNTRTDTQSGISLSKTRNSASFVINGTATAMSSIVATSSIILPAGTYIVSVEGLNKMTADTDRCYLWNQENSKVIVNGIMTDKAKTFTLLEATSIRAEFVFAEGTSYTNKIVTIQIEKGDTVSEFEEYNADTYTPAADGTVDGLTSIPPTMTILTDTEGVTVECEYNKDTNKVISKLVNAIMAMGGEVTI